jgi:hypothetical protein
MFTKIELNVLQLALQQYQGPYGYNNHKSLTIEEIKYNENHIKIAEQLRLRFEEILQYYWEMKV